MITGNSGAVNFDFIQFQGHSITTSEINSFTDSASANINASPDFCGEKVLTYKIDSQVTNELEGMNKEQIKFSPKVDSKIFGTFNASQIVTLKDYPSIQKVIEFQVTILAPVNPIVPDQNYTI